MPTCFAGVISNILTKLYRLLINTKHKAYLRLTGLLLVLHIFRHVRKYWTKILQPANGRDPKHKSGSLQSLDYIVFRMSSRILPLEVMNIRAKIFNKFQRKAVICICNNCSS